MPKEKERIKWYLTPIGVVLLLFFVLGPFGLPLLCRSPRFSKTSKIILTIAVVIYTIYLIFASVEIARQLYSGVGELKDMLKQKSPVGGRLGVGARHWTREKTPPPGIFAIVQARPKVAISDFVLRSKTAGAFTKKED